MQEWVDRDGEARWVVFLVDFWLMIRALLGSSSFIDDCREKTRETIGSRKTLFELLILVALDQHPESVLLAAMPSLFPGKQHNENDEQQLKGEVNEEKLLF